MDCQFVNYLGTNELLRQMIVHQGWAIGIFDENTASLWFIDHTEIPVPRSHIEPVKRETRFHPKLVLALRRPEPKVLDDDLPPVTVAKWVSGKTYSEVKRQAKAAGFDVDLALAVYRWHRLMARVEHLTRDTMSRAWKEARGRTRRPSRR